MKSYIFTIHLPALSAPQRGVITVLTPSGVIEVIKLNDRGVASVHDVHTYCEDLFTRMYSDDVNSVHGSVVMWEGPYDSSGLVTVVRVDVDS